MGGNEESNNILDRKEEEEMQGFIQLWKHMFGFMDSLGLRWAVEMEIPDMLSTCPLSAEEIASHLPSPSPNIDFLCRILSFLATRGILSQTITNSQVKYGLTPMTKWLVKNRPAGDSMNSTFLMHTHEAVITPWYRFRDCVLGGGFPFEIVHGEPLFTYAQMNPDFGKLFNDAMASHSKMLMKHILSAYSDGFKVLTSVVDVGGGNGSTVSRVAEAFPHIKCCNFDLPHVIRDAPRVEVQVYNTLEGICS